MHETIIERVIRAAWTELDSQTGWSGSIDFDPVARAILTSMREPTPALLDAMMAAEAATGDNAAIWNAAIEAALEETVG